MGLPYQEHRQPHCAKSPTSLGCLSQIGSWNEVICFRLSSFASKGPFLGVTANQGTTKTIADAKASFSPECTSKSRPPLINMQIPNLFPSLWAFSPHYGRGPSG
ncbi:hypothetical protein CRV24_001281 [Beauveria bassiana]|nr:hypothetical protein CRV24_001281 [Beauveria bassiana]